MGKNNQGNLDPLADLDDRLPVPLGQRTFRGDLDICIDSQGLWHYNQAPLTCENLVALLASMLLRDDAGVYWLVTPTEMGRIKVADAPLLAVDFIVTGKGPGQRVNFLTNADDVIAASTATPLIMKPSPVSGSIMPYLINAQGVEAKLSRTVYFALLEWGTTLGDTDPPGPFGVWSGGVFFPLSAHFKTDA